jgi:hypothetical protein
MESLFYHYGFPDLARVLANAVTWALAERPVLEVDAPDFVEATLMAQSGRMLVHLVVFAVGKPVNAGWRQIGRNLVTARDIRVRLALSEGRAVREVRLATSEASLTFTPDGNSVEVLVPQVADHEIVIFELTAATR